MCAEAFPEGLLDEAVFHWAVASREGGAWSAPPDGWQSDPSRSTAAGAPPLSHCTLALSVLANSVMMANIL